MATSSTKRLSGGANLGVTRGSTSRGSSGVGGGGSSPGAIATGSLNIPTLNPTAQPVDTFQRTSVPNAPESTYIFTPPALPEPSPDLKNLAKALGSLNTNLKGAIKGFAESELIANTNAVKEAEGIAAKLEASGGNLLAPLDNIRKQNEVIINDDKASVEDKGKAQAQYNLLRNIDPRTEDYLQYTKLKQHAQTHISGLLTHVQGLKGPGGEPLIVNPYAVNGEPSPLDLEINSYVNQIDDPHILRELRPQILAQTTNAKAWMSARHAEQVDTASAAAFRTNINNTTNSLLTKKSDKVDGTLLSNAWETARTSGMSSKEWTNQKTNFIPNLAESIVLAGGGDLAKTQELLKKAQLELNNARVGAKNEKTGLAPLLINSLPEGSGAAFELETQVYQVLNQAKTSRDKINTELGAADQHTRNMTALGGFEDGDIDKAGVQPFTYDHPTEIDPKTKKPKQITSSISLEMAYEYIATERDRIMRTYTGAERTSRLNTLSNFETNLNNGKARTVRNDNYNIIQDHINRGTDSRTVYSLIKFYERKKLLSKDQVQSLSEQVLPDVKEEDKQLIEMIGTAEQNLLKQYQSSGEKGQLIPEGDDARIDNRFSLAEINLANQLMRPLRTRAAAIMKDPNKTHTEKIAEIQGIYSEAQNIFNQRIKESKQSPGVFVGAAKALNEPTTTTTTETPATKTETPVTKTETPATTTETPATTTETEISSEDQPIQSLKLETPPNNVVLSAAHAQVSAEARERFSGLKGQLGIGERLTHELLATHPEFVRKWYEQRLKEVIYQRMTGNDPRGTGGDRTTTAEKSTLFKGNPSQVLASLSGGKRGNTSENVLLANEIQSKALYEKPVLIEQVNALLNGEKFIPYAGDLNKILKRANVEPIDFFKAQFKIHTGQDMPIEVENKLRETLSTKGKQGGYRGILYRPVKKNNELAFNTENLPGQETGQIASTETAGLFNNPNLEIPAGGGNKIPSGSKRELEMLNYERQLEGLPPLDKLPNQSKEDLQEGMLTASIQDGKNISPRLSTNRTKLLDLIHSVESTVDVEGGGYEAFNQKGVKEGQDTEGFTGTYGNHPANKGKKLTNLTIQEILDIQESGYDTKKYPWTKAGDKKWFASGGIHAAGRYQMTKDFIKDALSYSGIDPNTKFTPEIQDQLAIAYILGMKKRNQKLGKVWIGLGKEGNEQILKEAQKALEELLKPDTTESSTISPSTGLA